MVTFSAPAIAARRTAQSSMARRGSGVVCSGEARGAGATSGVVRSVGSTRLVVGVGPPSPNAGWSSHESLVSGCCSGDGAWNDGRASFRFDPASAVRLAVGESPVLNAAEPKPEK